MTREQLLAAAEAAEREVRDLTARYPGVCPSWVSCDVALAADRARRYREEAEKLSC